MFHVTHVLFMSVHFFLAINYTANRGKLCWIISELYLRGGNVSVQEQINYFSASWLQIFFN